MSSLHIDCPTGLAGDMMLAALLDLGVPIIVVEDSLKAIGLDDCYRLELQEGKSAGLRGKRLNIINLGNDAQHRSWSDIKFQIEKSSLESDLKQNVLAVFLALAEAESQVHGVLPEDVHFHELGSLDTLVDVVGVCSALKYLALEKISCAPPPVGRGTVSTSHGILPVPVPVVLELARRHGLQLCQDVNLPAGELTTPTGLALVAVLADFFNPPLLFTTKKIGVGLGSRSLGTPNFLRISLIDNSDDNLAPRWQSLLVQEAWIDDSSPEDISLLVEELRLGGALDVSSKNLMMKKGRMGVAVTALVAPERAADLRNIWFNQGSSIGLREQQQGRWLLPRRSGWLNTDWGQVRAKQVLLPDGCCRVKPEFDSLERLSRTSGCSIAKLRDAAISAAFIKTEDWSW